ncbi:MAG TPA: signal peptidase II [bacterium]|nr:signal peptidase II [bacterium]HPJ72077.1 signal peptidase II [bacterium]HPQ65141.1 signal peptidase II [bacterium]
MAGLIAFVCVFCLDQVCKWLAVANLAPGRPLSVVPGFFNLTLVYNRGGAFGLFPGKAGVFIVLSLVIIGVLLVCYRRIFARGRMFQVCAGLILGGAVGNLLDRFHHAHVIDFLDFYLGKRHWPAFNIADSAICVGVGLLIVLSMAGKDRVRRPQSAPGAPAGEGNGNG